MPTKREDLMDEAFPQIREQLARAAKEGTPWRSLFDALGKRSVTDSSRHIRVILGEEVRVDLSINGTTATETTARLLPHARVRTVMQLNEADLATLQSPDAPPIGKVRDWATQAVSAGNLMLFKQLERELANRSPVSCTLDQLPQSIRDARALLKGQAMNLLVSEGVFLQVIAEEARAKTVKETLWGGTLAPVGGLETQDGYIIRHGAGDVVVEIAQELTSAWDIAAGTTVEIIAWEEFALVAEKKVPAYQLKL